MMGIWFLGAALGNLLAGMLHSSDKLHIWTWSGTDFYWEELERNAGSWKRPGGAVGGQALQQNTATVPERHWPEAQS